MSLILLNQIFGKENFVNEIVWSYQGTGEPKIGYKKKHDYIIFYAKDINKIYFNSNNAKEEISEFSKSKYNKEDENGKYKEIRHSDGKIYKQYIKEKMIMRSVWELPVINAQAIERIQSNINLTQKPEALLERIIKASSNKNSIIMDFFAGSGTSLAVALKLGRKFIGVEMGEHFYDVIIPRLKKTLSGFESGISKDASYKGGGIFKYYELESYENVLANAIYSDTPKEYLEICDNSGDAFLFDERLSKCVCMDKEEISLNLNELYSGKIDLKESLLNVKGKKIKQISNGDVIYTDGNKESLINAFREFLIW